MGKSDEMMVRREVHALDYSVCSTVALLDQLFRPHSKTWDVSKGLNLEINDRRQDTYREFLVIVHPVGWKKDLENIVLRCAYGFRGWAVFEGAVNSYRLPEAVAPQFVFRIDILNSSQIIRSVNKNTSEEKFLVSIGRT